MIAQKDPYIRSAYQQLQIISQDKQKCYQVFQKVMNRVIMNPKTN